MRDRHHHSSVRYTRGRLFKGKIHYFFQYKMHKYKIANRSTILLIFSQCVSVFNTGMHVREAEKQGLYARIALHSTTHTTRKKKSWSRGKQTKLSFQRGFGFRISFLISFLKLLTLASLANCIANNLLTVKTLNKETRRRL